jgi:hypothetical protein
MYRNHFPTYQEKSTEEFHEWVGIATRGLASWEKPRIRTEIEAHIQEATEESVSKGWSPENARRRAVLALGSPREANKGYLRSRSIMHVEHELMNVKRSPCLFEYTQSNVFARIFSLTGILFVMAVCGLAITIFEPGYFPVGFTACLAFSHRVYAYKYLFPKLMKTNAVRQIYQHVQYSTTLTMFTFLSLGTFENHLYFLVPLALCPMMLGICFYAGRRIPDDLKWSDIRVD